jgi:hypothetical protein
MGKNIPAEYVNNIRSFAAHNPDYEVNLWLQRPSLFLNTISRNDGGSFPAKIRDFKEILPKINMKMQSYLKREMVGLYPNFASASDILRLYILFEEGGIYLDTDLKPESDLETDSPQKFGDVDAPYGFLFNIKVKDNFKELTQESPVKFNNNMLAAVPQSPYLKEVIDEMNLRYEKVSPEVLWQEKRSTAMPISDPHKTDRFRYTIYLSGPVLMEQIFYRNFLKAGFDSYRPSIQKREFNKLRTRIANKQVDIDQLGVLAPFNKVLDRNDNTWCRKKSSTLPIPPCEH